MSDKVVVDASLAAMWALAEEFSIHALHLAGLWAASNTKLLTPALMLAEVNNAIYKRVTRKELTLANAKAAFEVILAFPFEVRDSLSLQIRALEMAEELRRPATYDCQYLALAELEGCEMWTGDKRLFHAVRNTLSWARWVGDIQLPKKTAPKENEFDQR